MKIDPGPIDLGRAQQALEKVKDPFLLWEYKTDDSFVSNPTPGPDGIYVNTGSSQWKSDHMGSVHKLDDEGQLQWKFDTRGGVRSAPTPWQSRLYVNSDWGNFYALDSSDGHLLWQAEKQEGDFRCSPAVDDQGNAYGLSTSFEYFERGVATPVAKLVKLKAESGQVAWSKTFTGGMSPDDAAPVLGPGGTVLLAAEKALVCLDQQSGEERWRFPLEGRGGRPIVSGQRILIGSIGNDERHLVRAIEAGGKELWSFENKDVLGHNIPSLALDEAAGNLFVGDWGKSVYCVDANTGAEKWARQPGGYGAFKPAVGAEGEVYFAGGRTEKFHVFDAKTGDNRWNFVGGSRLAQVPLHHHEIVYVAAEGRLVALAEDALARKLEAMKAVPQGPELQLDENLLTIGDISIEVR
ncbi:MAG: PQQ-binding-like beta-propeller repeat protein [Vulcanimicrobiota bacterium]